jgi:hypothetical protein
MMATVGSYETKSGRRWRVRYRTPDGGQTDKRGFTTKRDAREFAVEIEMLKATGDFVSASAGRVTIGELASAWLDKKKHSIAPSHYRTLESAWRMHVRSDWDARRVADVTALEVWISRLARQGYGSTTVRRAPSVLSASSPMP